MDCKTYFEAFAPHWDDSYVAHAPERRAAAFLCGAGAGLSVLDIACGTGAMIPELLERAPAQITAIDVCPGMAQRAAEKFFGEPTVSVLCADFLTWQPPHLFDTALLYNAYPHFIDKSALLAAVFGALAPGGRFTVAHGMGRATLNRHHGNVPPEVCTPLGAAREETVCWARWFMVDILCDAPNFYCISGVRRQTPLSPDEALCTADAKENLVCPLVSTASSFYNGSKESVGSLSLPGKPRLPQETPDNLSARLIDSTCCPQTLPHSEKLGPWAAKGGDRSL